MEKITIPDKTFTLYQNGTRTFIHIPRDEKARVLKETLQYGDIITLVNKETNEEFEQFFWFIFDWKESEKFLFLVFAWDTTTPLFFQRKAKAHSLSDRGASSPNESTMWFSNYQKHSYSSLKAFSSMFFINPRQAIELPGTIFCFVEGNDEKSQAFMITDVLVLLRPNEEKACKVLSLFPMNLYH